LDRRVNVDELFPAVTPTALQVYDLCRDGCSLILEGSTRELAGLDGGLFRGHPCNLTCRPPKFLGRLRHDTAHVHDGESDHRFRVG
jgi:hypothetical protein